MAQLPLPEQERSYWTASTPRPAYSLLKGEVTVDVAVIGAGIAGLSAAYLLKQAGLKVAVLERKTVGAGVTGNTTGKVTSQHNLCYTKLQKNIGQKRARLYAQANQSAIEQMERIITRESIDCDWQRDTSYVFTEKPEEVAALKQEAAIAKALGLPAAFDTVTALPFAVKGAVRFDNQAKFHSRKYVIGLARAVNSSGSHVFEHSEATSVKDGDPCVVTTKQGKLIAKDVILATNVPFPPITHLYYGLYEYPLKSYIIAARYNRDLAGMYITPGSPIRSILPFTSGNERLLLIGGESHFPGVGNARHRHQTLADYAQERFGITEVAYRWSAWDYLANDGVPLIGKRYPWSRHTFVATGFMKWGLTTSMVAGAILTDMILHKPNPWLNVYNASRFSPIASLPKAVVAILRHGL